MTPGSRSRTRGSRRWCLHLEPTRTGLGNRLRAGIELATERYRAARGEFLFKILGTLPVEPYGLATAEAHGRLLAHVHRSGTTRGAHDLVIAATAVATRRTVLTTDRSARFHELPGVTCLVVG